MAHVWEEGYSKGNQRRRKRWVCIYCNCTRPRALVGPYAELPDPEVKIRRGGVHMACDEIVAFKVMES